MITEDKVRLYLIDRTASDNPMDGDLQFSSEDIAEAMKDAVREWNSVPPPVFPLSMSQAQCLPDNTNVFFDAIVASLYRRQVLKEQKKDVPLSAGNMTGDITARRIQHFTTTAKEYQEKFFQAANYHKKVRNLQDAFGIVG